MMCTFGLEVASALSEGDEVVLRTTAKTVLEGSRETWRMNSSWDSVSHETRMTD